MALQLQMIPDVEVGRRTYTAKVDPELKAAIDAIAKEHPAVSPYFLVPGDDEKAQKSFLRQVKALAADLVDSDNPLGRRLLLGTHTSTKAPVWALGGPIKPRKTNAKKASVSDEAMDAGSQAGVNAAVKASGSKR